MLTIWKTELKLQSVQEIMVPRGSEFLSCMRVESENPFIGIWYKCDPRQQMAEKHKIYIVCTGEDNEIVKNAKFLGSFYYLVGHQHFVGHVFYE